MTHKPDPRWTPGAWTPDRCKLWRLLDGPGKARLEKWVMAEHVRGICHPRQLPGDGLAEDVAEKIKKPGAIRACLAI